MDTSLNTTDSWNNNRFYDLINEEFLWEKDRRNKIKVEEVKSSESINISEASGYVKK
jgi:hypothetical protein